MKAASILPLIPLFPLLGFLVNGLLYLVSHAKLGSKDAPKGPHGHGGEGEGGIPGGPGHHPHKAEIDGHGHTHPPAHATVDAHGHGAAPEEHAHHEIPFAAAHSIVGPVSCGLSLVAAVLAIVAWWGETHGESAV